MRARAYKVDKILDVAKHIAAGYISRLSIRADNTESLRVIWGVAAALVEIAEEYVAEEDES